MINNTSPLPPPGPKKSKLLRWLCLIAIAVLLGIAVCFIVLIPFFRGDFYLDSTGMHSRSDVPQVTTVNGVPDVWKSREEDYHGIKYNYIYFSGKKETVDEHITYMQFDSRRRARKAYKLMKRNGFSSIDEEGRNYFIGWEDGVTDASIQQMICLSGKLIIRADVYVSSEWPSFELGDAPSAFSYPERKQYILNHYAR